MQAKKTIQKLKLKPVSLGSWRNFSETNPIWSILFSKQFLFMQISFSSGWCYQSRKRPSLCTTGVASSSNWKAHHSRQAKVIKGMNHIIHFMKLIVIFTLSTNIFLLHNVILSYWMPMRLFWHHCMTDSS